MKFRLTLVLRTMDRPGKAADWRDQALSARKEWEKRLPEFRELDECTDEDDMKLFDIEVILHHGWAMGIWSDGRHWLWIFDRLTRLDLDGQGF